MFSFCPILKSMVSYCNTKRAVPAKFIKINNFFVDILLAYDHTQCLPY